LDGSVNKGKSKKAKMLIRYTKNLGKYDDFECFLSDGRTHKVQMPKIGSLPHDLVHFVVEKELKMTNGFYAHVEKGLVEGYYLKTERSENPEQSAIDAQHAESVVECFQAEFVSGNQSAEDFQYFVNVTCEARKIPHFPIKAEEIERIRKGLFKLNERWEAVKIGETLELEY
jgi:hypothetical protein